MIRLVSGATAGDFSAFCRDDPMGIRMSAAFSSYGTDFPFADFWLVYDEENNVTGALSRLDGDMTLLLKKPSDEVKAFVCAAGAATLTGSEKTLRMLSFGENLSSGHIMELCRADKPFVSGKSGLELCLQPSVMEFCKFLSACEDENIRLGSFERFYTDLSHRVRRKTAICALGKYRTETVSAAAASAVCDGGILIGAVAVRKDMRGLHFGSETVGMLVNELLKIGGDAKKIYLFRSENENKSFYERLGFKDTGKWATVLRRCDMDGDF